MSTLTKSCQRVAHNRRSATTIPRFPEFSSATSASIDRQKIKRADRCADVEKTNLLSNSEARCQSEGCIKLLTLRIVENYSQGFYFGRPMPASGLAGGIPADFRKAPPMTPEPLPLKKDVVHRCDRGGHRGGAATLKAGNSITVF
jgi:hypothetical protein